MPREPDGRRRGRSLPVRDAARLLRAHRERDGRDAPRARHPDAARHRVRTRRAQPAHRVLRGAAVRRARVGRGLLPAASAGCPTTRRSACRKPRPASASRFMAGPVVRRDRPRRRRRRARAGEGRGRLGRVRAWRPPARSRCGCGRSRSALLLAIGLGVASLRRRWRRRRDPAPTPAGRPSSSSSLRSSRRDTCARRRRRRASSSTSSRPTRRSTREVVRGRRDRRADVRAGAVRPGRARTTRPIERALAAARAGARAGRAPLSRRTRVAVAR